MNKKRLLKLLEIFRRHSDFDHKLSLNQIVSLLEEDGITVNNRKTLYDDIREISEYVGEIEYDSGYYLESQDDVNHAICVTDFYTYLEETGWFG